MDEDFEEADDDSEFGPEIGKKPTAFIKNCPKSQEKRFRVVSAVQHGISLVLCMNIDNDMDRFSWGD